MNWPLKTTIIERFGTQADFAHAIHGAEAIVSKVVRGRLTLPAEEKKRWATALGDVPERLFSEEVR